MKALLGGKGANLAEMSSLGLPAPPGFTITTEVCTYFYKNDNRYPDDLEQQVNKALATIEDLVGATFGDATTPLLLSVRSGAPPPIPAMRAHGLHLGTNAPPREGPATPP